MKVRHKQTGFECEGERHGDYYVLSAFIGPALKPKSDAIIWIKYAVLASDYEPFPAEQWQDVTGECEWEESRRSILRNGLMISHDDLRYRLRKVQIPHYSNGQVMSHSWAFIVERKEE